MRKLKVLLLSFAMFLFCGSVFSATPKVIRVGFFAFDGYHHVDEDGYRTGYGYEFLQRIRQYTTWKYDYVGYEDSWGEMQQLLENGEIDLLTSAQKTPKREALFDYSNRPIGYSATMLTIKAGNEKYVSGDYEGYDGMRVGMVEGNSRNDSFDNFASAHGFSYTRVYYDDTESLSKALQEGKDIDAILTSNLREVKNEWILDQFDSSPFYVIVRKGDTELLKEVDKAIAQLDLSDPEWRDELREKYYTPENGDQISFTGEERRYLTRMKSEGHVFTVAVNPDRRPYSYLDDEGKPAGIIVSSFERLMGSLSLRYQYVETKDRNEYMAAIDSGKAEIWLDAFNDYSYTETKGYKLTSPYLKTGISRITRHGWVGKEGKIAAPKDADITRTFLRNYFPDERIDYYDSLEACIQAVRDGTDDICFSYVYTAQLAVMKDPKQKLEFSLLPDASVSFSFAVEERQDELLLGVLNKAVPVIKPYIDTSIVDATVRNERRVSLVSFIYANPVLSLVIIFSICFLLFLTILLLAKVKIGRRQQRTDKELARFTGYVCQSYDKVMEINIQSGAYKLYVWKDGAVISRMGTFDIIGNKDAGGHVHPDDMPRIRKMISKEHLSTMIENGGERYFEARWRPDGDSPYQWYSFAIQAMPIDKDHPENFILFRRNINEAKEQEQQQTQALTDALATAKQASTAKGTFLSRMSHEIRTPLNAVIGYMEIARMHEDDKEKVLHCLENSEVAAKHLLSIINSVLDISAIESGRIKIANADFNLKGMLTTITSIFYNQSKEKDIRFVVKVESLYDEWVVGDQLRMNQVLMNLLSNAIKFTPKDGEVSLIVSQSQHQEDSNVYIRFVVSDTGIGMSKEYLGRIFTPFEQESASTARQFGGTGLGLSITKNLITMMGGVINVDSVQGKGTTFLVQMKFGKSKENEQHDIPQDFSALRALVVDDDKDSCDYVKELLKRCGVKSDTVSSGAAALKQIQRRLQADHPYDICIMDWNMPDLNGVETAKLIRKETGSSIPIIIATAYDVSDISESAKDAGVSKVIAKPLFHSTMFDLLVDTFGKYKPKAKSNTEGHVADLKGCRILLAEDNGMNMEIAKDILENSGLIIDGVENGRIAVDTFLSAKPYTYDAILMDIQMPVMDGYAATKEIRNSDTIEAKTIPIIAMTANAFSEDVAQALASGMNDHIGKPIDYDKLFHVLGKYIKKKEGNGDVHGV